MVWNHHNVRYCMHVSNETWRMRLKLHSLLGIVRNIRRIIMARHHCMQLVSAGLCCIATILLWYAPANTFTTCTFISLKLLVWHKTLSVQIIWTYSLHQDNLVHVSELSVLLLVHQLDIHQLRLVAFLLQVSWVVVMLPPLVTFSHTSLLLQDCSFPRLMIWYVW